jgi:hypothetical protein
VAPKHPGLSSEQAHIERVRESRGRILEQRESAPNADADRAVSRQLRIKDNSLRKVDLERLCFSRINPEPGDQIYNGREAVWGKSARDLLAAITLMWPLANASTIP